MYRNDFVVESFNDEERAYFSYWLKGDESALEMCELIASGAHMWDDLIDGDKAVTHEQIHKGIMALSIGLMRNAFFLENIYTLLPLLEQAMYDWIESTRLEKGEGYPLAFALRSTYVSLMIRGAYIVGGYEWGQDASAYIRGRLMDDWPDFKKEHGGSDGLAQQTESTGSDGGGTS